MFPNPTTGKVTLKSTGNPILNYKVYNVFGKEVAAEITNYELDLSSQPSGIYFLKLNSTKSTIVKRINLNK